MSRISTKFIADNAVTNAKLAQMAADTIKGNSTAGTANASDLTGAQVNTILPVFTSSLNGLAPSSGGGTTNYLRADGTWVAPPGATTLTSLGIRSGQTTIGSGVTTSGTITFSTTLGTTSYSITATMVNTTDTNPEYIPVTVVTQTATGFSVSWNAATPTANYVLNWQAIVNN